MHSDDDDEPAPGMIWAMILVTCVLIWGGVAYGLWAVWP